MARREGFEPPTARSVAWCSASIWSAPDRSGLLTLEDSSIPTDREGSCRIVWMIKRMIKQVRRPGEPRRLKDTSRTSGRGPARRHGRQLSEGRALTCGHDPAPGPGCGQSAGRPRPRPGRRPRRRRPAIPPGTRSRTAWARETGVAVGVVRVAVRDGRGAGCVVAGDEAHRVLLVTRFTSMVAPIVPVPSPLTSPRSIPSGLLKPGLGLLGLSGLQLRNSRSSWSSIAGGLGCAAGHSGGRAHVREAQRQHGEHPVRPSHGVLLGRRQEPRRRRERMGRAGRGGRRPGAGSSGRRGRPSARRSCRPGSG